MGKTLYLVTAAIVEDATETTQLIRFDDVRPVWADSPVEAEELMLGHWRMRGARFSASVKHVAAALGDPE